MHSLLFCFFHVACPVVICIFVIVFLLFKMQITSSTTAYCLVPSLMQLRVDLLFVCLYCLLFVLFVSFTSNNTVMHKLKVVLVWFPLAVR